jgi:hypothetical protein
VIGRGPFLAGSVALAAASAGRASALVPAPGRGYPDFTWDRVPYAAQIGKFRGDFSAAEIDFIARRFAFIAVGPGTGLGDKPAAERIQEVGFYRTARALKQANPACKVLFFWGVPGNIHNYAAYADYDPSWRLPDARGDGWGGDASNPGFRAWWARSAARIVAHPDVDGVFVDGANPEGDHPFHTAMLQALRAALVALPKPALLLVNGVPAPGKDGLPSILDLCDGIMIEYFGIVGKRDPDKLKEYMLDVVRLGKAGKIVMARTFPGFTFFDPEVRDWSYARKLDEAKRNVGFSLATYLAVAQRYTYLQYGWGYENIGGAYVLEADGVTPDPAWYPEFLKPLGEPLEDPRVDGYVFTRRFRHAAVRVDLLARSGRVDFAA